LISNVENRWKMLKLGQKVVEMVDLSKHWEKIEKNWSKWAKMNKIGWKLVKNCQKWLQGH
jgi:hypothetical protein